MKSIGFRAEKDSINWAVVSVEGEDAVIEEHGEIRAPKAYSTDSEILGYFRAKVRETIGRYSPVAAGIRYPETGGKAPRYLASAYARCRVEGVIAEVVGAEGIRLVCGALNTLGAELGSSSAKAYLDPQAESVRGVEFKMKSPTHREAVLVAVAALEASRGNRN
jgi:hypothetical protein